MRTHFKPTETFQNTFFTTRHPPIGKKGFAKCEALRLLRTTLHTKIWCYYIDTDEIPGFLLLPKNHIITARRKDTIFIFHEWGYWCGHGYTNIYNYPITIEPLAQARGRLIWNFIHKMTSRCEDGRVIGFFSSLLELWLFRTENINIIFLISLFKLYIWVS